MSLATWTIVLPSLQSCRAWRGRILHAATQLATCLDSESTAHLPTLLLGISALSWIEPFWAREVTGTMSRGTGGPVQSIFSGSADADLET